MTEVSEYKGHIVFDCDGTLISSIEGIFKGIQIVMSDVLGREVTRDEAISKYDADMEKFAKNFNLDVSDENVREELLAKWAKVLEGQRNKYDLFDGIKELISNLDELGYRLYVWTARDRASTLAILKSLDVAKYFYDFRCMDDTIPKPHPMGLEQLVGEFDRSKTIMIGDSPTDIRGAKAFGCRSIGALWCSFSSKSDLAEMEADFLVEKPQDCLEIIKENI
jgi:phosphoglycolate phosphatase